MAKIEILRDEVEFSVDGGLSTIVRDEGDVVEGVPMAVANSLASDGRAEIIEADPDLDESEAAKADAQDEFDAMSVDDVRGKSADELRSLAKRLGLNPGPRAGKKGLVEALLALKGEK